MAANFHPCEGEDEDYIDMEVSSQSHLISHSANSPPQTREFEFQKFSTPLERETSSSPADELFYKGKLLPLHLPPRLEMVEKLLQSSDSHEHKAENFEECFSTPLATTVTNTPTATTPYSSCNVSPSQSFRAGGELKPDELYCRCSTETTSFIGEKSKKSWARKLKLIKQSSLYLKCLFNKSNCSDKSCNTATIKIEERSVPKTKECSDQHKKGGKKIPFGQIQRKRHPSPVTLDRRFKFNQEKVKEDIDDQPRKSFSGAIKWFSTSKITSYSSSSSCSSNSNECRESQFLRRSSSVKSDNENPVQGAIAHCKRSQQRCHSRKGEVSRRSLSPTRIVCEDQERPGLCRNCERVRGGR